MSSLGIFTHRDFFLVDTNANTLTKRIQDFKKLETASEVKSKLNLTDTRDWKIDIALKTIKKNDLNIETYQYRPFDKRFICYNLEMFDRGCSRFDLMETFLKKQNVIAIISGRAGQNVTPHLDWNLVSVSNTLSDANVFSRGGATVFPIYISTASQIDTQTRPVSNFKPEFLKQLN